MSQLPPNAGQTARLPRWFGARLAIWAACVPALAVLGLAAGFVWYERGELLSSEQALNELYVRTLEGQLNQTLSSAELALQAIARQLQGLPEEAPPADDVTPLLSQPLGAMPYLRSVSLLDADGLVLASSNAANVGVHLPLDLLRRRPKSRPAGLAAAQTGRDLEDSSLTSTRHVSVQSWIPLTLPLSLSLPRLGGQAGPMYLVAALNPDFFANQLHQQLDSTPRRAALATLEAQLIATTDAVQTPVGTLLRSHIAFSNYLPGQEHGSFQAPGLDERMSLGSFRTTRQYPWVILVELPVAELDARTRELAQPVMLASLASLALIAALALLAWRGMQSYEQAQLALAVTQRGLAERVHEQEALLHGLPALVLRTDARGELRFVSRRDFFPARGSLPVLGLALEELVVEADRPLLRALLDAQEGPTRGPVRLHLLDESGATPCVELRLSEIRDGAQGRLIGFYGLAVELGER